MDEDDGPMRAAYRALEYRLETTEALMVHPLLQIPRTPEILPVNRVVTQERADQLAKIARKRLALPEHFGADSPLRLYVALDGETPVGWLRSITVGNCAWVSNVYVEAKYRRQGIGRSMLTTMLRDDRAHNIGQSVLLASHTGALLYPRVGYQQIGELFVYTPRKR
jgi:GNAT superfamily N-acetyltransferase